MDCGQERAINAAQAAARKKALDIIVLDLKGIFPVADYFVVCSGRSTAQLAAIVREVEDELKKHSDNDGFYRRQGSPESGWILLDNGDVVIHIFSEEAREFYDIERLWGDGRVIMESS
ncbi:MAG TPA: ribosome silencing factor [Syntrophomonadaceae bacterium]|nr:ribosome silencing factor [Syntrophomonadaceae bacterium]